MSKKITTELNEKLDQYKDYMARIGKEKIPCYEPLLGQEEINNLKNDLIKHADLENYIKDPDIGVKVKKSKKVKIKKSST